MSNPFRVGKRHEGQVGAHHGGKYEAEKKGVEVPGPGNYSPNIRFVEEKLTHGFTFGSRAGSLEDLKKLASKTIVPGPGNYNTEATTMAKRSPVFGSEIRPGVALKSMIKNPGPGSYADLLDTAKASSPKYRYVHELTT